MRIRAFRIGDEAALHVVFLSAIHEIASKDYKPEQIEAWAATSLDPDIWIKRMQAIRPFIVESEEEIVAYTDVQPSGHMNHFFVSTSHARASIGTMLMNRIREAASIQGIGVLTSDVSRSAQPFFARFGFVIVEQRAPVIRGVVVPNALMRCAVTANNTVESAPPKLPAEASRLALVNRRRLLKRLGLKVNPLRGECYDDTFTYRSGKYWVDVPETSLTGPV